jgi:hypothetical protein
MRFMCSALPTTGSIEGTASLLIAILGAVNLHSKKACETLHVIVLHRHTNTSIAPHGCFMLGIHFASVNGHV